MKFRGGEFSTGTTGNFQPELTQIPVNQKPASGFCFLSSLKYWKPGKVIWRTDGFHGPKSIDAGC